MPSRSLDTMSLPELSPDVIDAVAPTPESEARGLLLAIFEQAIRESRGEFSTYERPESHARLIAQARAYLRRRGGVGEWGSAAFICAQLDFDHEALLERLGLAERIPQAVPAATFWGAPWVAKGPDAPPRRRAPKSAEAIAKMKATIAARKAAGLPFGRPREHPVVIVTSVCARCGDTFSHRQATPRVVCSKACAQRCGSHARRVLPPDGFVGWLYDGGFSLWQLARHFQVRHKAIHRAVVASGVARHRRGRTAAVTCREPGCDQPPHKVAHKRLGVSYGTRCHPHWVAYRRALADRIHDRKLAQLGRTRTRRRKRPPSTYELEPHQERAAA